MMVPEWTVAMVGDHDVEDRNDQQIMGIKQHIPYPRPKGYNTYSPVYMSQLHRLISNRFRANTSKTRNFKVHALLQINILSLRVNIAQALTFKNIQHSKPQKQHV